MHRGVLRLRVTCGLMTSVVLGVSMRRPLRVTPRVRRVKIRANLLVEAAHGCRAVMALLLTLLGV